MPEGTVKWFNAELASDLGAPETASSRTDFALASAIPDGLGEALTGVGPVSAVVALGLGVALGTVLLRHETGRSRRGWRWTVVAGAVTAMAGLAGITDLGGDQSDAAVAALEFDPGPGIVDVMN